MTAVSLATLALPCGCSRGHYRQQADKESYQVIQERPTDPRWEISRLCIDPDPRSRFAHPYDEDHPPMPPDDDTAHEYMHCADGKKGYAKWHKHGDVDQVENPEWQNYLDLNKDGVLVLDEEKAIQMALLHSRTYQQQVENLYLNALDLTFERFRFDTWYFAGNNTTFRHFGSSSIDNPLTPLVNEGNETNTLTTSTTASARGAGSSIGAGRLFPAGQTLLVDFANSFVWQFAGSGTSSRTNSILSMSFVQPLLRNAGREVVMERLTLQERSVLYAVRSFAQYQQDFYVDITTGAGRGISVSRRGGQFGAGLEGFTGQGGGFGGVVGGATRGAGITSATTGGAGAGQLGGFLGLVQQRLNVRNLEYNVAATADSLAQLGALQEAGRVDIIQVDQARQRLATARSNLLQRTAAYENGLDNFKQTLGLPPEMKVDVDETKFVSLELIDRGVVDLQNQIESLLNRVRELPDAPTPSEIQEVSEEARKFTGPAEAAFAQAKQDIAVLRAGLNKRVQSIESEPERKVFLEDMQKLFENHRGLEKRFDATLQSLIGRPKPDTAEQRKDLQQRLTELSGQLLELSLMQTRARLEVVEIPLLEFTEEKAIQTALDSELSLMNARAQLVDSWRAIELQADRLESDLNLTFNADTQTLPIGGLHTNPFDFRGANSSLTMGIRFDAPLTRVAERNLYRESLLDYQASRRNYIRTQDQIVATLRAELRTAELNRSNFELRRNALVIALRQVDQTREKLNEPPRVGAAGAQASSTTARDLLEALVNLLQNQDDFISVWFNSEAVRRSFYRDVGLMRMSENGLWVDAYRTTDRKAPDHESDSAGQSPGYGSGEASGEANQFPKLLPVRLKVPSGDEQLSE